MTKYEKNQILDFLNGLKDLGFEYSQDIHFTRQSKFSTLPNNLEKLSEYIHNCNLCDLSKIKVNIDTNYGKIDSGVYIIGTNPALLQNESFELLKKMVEQVLFLKIEDVHITNILRCPTGLDIHLPSIEKEIETCMLYLSKQLEITKPKLIISLGEAFNYLTGLNDNILEISGNSYKYNNIDLIPILHPSFILKNPSYKTQTFRDLKKIKFILESK